MAGYDIELLHSVCSAVGIPVIANGGAASIKDFEQAVARGGCSAVAAGSMFVFAAKGEGVLINYPSAVRIARTFLEPPRVVEKTVVERKPNKLNRNTFVPDILRVCTKTVMDNTDPDISFDEHGVSNWWT